MAGDHPEPSGSSEAQKAEAAGRSDEGLVPRPHIRDAREVPPDGDRPRAALPSGEIRFPDKYGVKESQLPRAVADHAVTARRYGEAAMETSGRLDAHLAEPEALRSRRAVEIQEELLRTRYAGLDERREAITEARVQAATHADPDQAASERAPDGLVVAQMYRDLADNERGMETVLFQRAKLHLEQARDWGEQAEREVGGDRRRQTAARGFLAEVSERLGGLKTDWAADNPGWVTGSGGALDDYRDAIGLYRSIGDHDAVERVSRLRDSLAATWGLNQDQDPQGS